MMQIVTLCSCMNFKVPENVLLKQSALFLSAETNQHESSPVFSALLIEELYKSLLQKSLTLMKKAFVGS